MASSRHPEAPWVILVPVYNDWEAADKLLVALDQELQRQQRTASVLIVDDASDSPAPGLSGERRFQALQRVQVLRLRRNLGHQRAVAVGLAYVEEQLPCKAVLIMDGDGEDAPADVARLMDQCEAEGYRSIIFAERTRRSESALFRVGYQCYRWLYRVLTGHNIRVGNFSAVPRERMSSLVAVSELWNHYAVAIFKSRQPCVTIPSCRGTRIDGRSQMSLVQLVIHGLSAISVYAELVSVRLLVASSGLIAVVLCALASVVMIRMFTTLAIPGWATYSVGLLLVILLQIILFSAILCFVILNSRHGTTIIPSRDYRYFVGPVTTWYESASSPTVPPTP